MTHASEQEYLAHYQKTDYDTPLFTVDMAIFSVAKDQLQVLMIQRSNFPEKGKWALPGGFVDLKTDPDLMATAHRKLLEKTGIQSPYLEQVETIGNQHRDPRGWSITALYFALIDFEKFAIQTTSTAEHSQWLSIDQALQLDLAFDHKQLLQLAFERLCNKTRYTTLPVSLMPEVFTLTELQNIYEIILGHTLEKKSFRRRMQEAGAVAETGQQKIVGKRPAQLFRYALEHYHFTFPRMLETPRNPTEHEKS
ncbi:NUDIX hydrolase [Acinetobacter courvalinii]|uniref:ADPR responsive transcriptional repressor NtrR n=1 Tax=Acinetobacter courvalinii TaxID=280147 RepID=UPI0021D176DB|nr:NUDIX hydrolase [Acinetobacter courvalinii]MCU4578840.1 NUDIX hydrolase [Acinetobacter courvalinii]